MHSAVIPWMFIQPGCWGRLLQHVRRSFWDLPGVPWQSEEKEIKRSDDPTGSTQSKQSHLERKRLAQVMLTQKNISARCKRFVRNTRMDFGALKAVLFLHSMGISWEQKAAFMWRTHHFRAHILASEPPEFCEAEGQNSDELAGIHIHREETK